MKALFKQSKWIIVTSILVAVITSLYWNDWLFQNCNVANISLRGGLWSHLTEDEATQDFVASKDIRETLLDVREDNGIDAVLISADSHGGSAAAGQEVAAAIKEVGKPVVVIVGDMALSAAYLAISPADAIFAYEQSEIGSIGVTMSYLENTEKNKKEGLSYVELNTAKYKEIASPDRSLSREERQILQKQLDEYHKLLVEDIADNRRLSLERVKSFA